MWGRKHMMETENTKNNPAFYIAVILYEAQVDAPDYQPIYQESFVLIQASSHQEAETKASSYAQQQQTSYQNEYHEVVTWSVKQVVDVNSVLTDTFEDGAELYARHFKNIQAYNTFESSLRDDL